MDAARTDRQLLSDFVRMHSEESFALLVSRYVNLVYTSAMRQVRQREAAEDVTQMVFAMLARKSAAVLHERVLAAWLISATRYTCLDLLKKEARRRRREQKVAQMRPDIFEPESTDRMRELSPLLDAALAALSEIDREAVVLKFFAGTNDRDAAGLLGMTENSLRQRRFRSLGKMRTYFRRHGVNVATDLLAGLMATGAVRPAPPHLATSVARHAVVASQGLLVAGMKGALIMSWLKANSIAVVAMVVLILSGTALLVAGFVRSHEPSTVIAKPQIAFGRPLPPARFGPGTQIPAQSYSEKQGGQDFPGGIGYLDTWTSLKYSNVDFGDDSIAFLACVAVPADHAGKQIVARIDRPDGAVIARMTVQSTGGWGKLAVQDTPLKPVRGLHDVYLNFTGNGVANLYWLQFATSRMLRHAPLPATTPTVHSFGA